MGDSSSSSSQSASNQQVANEALGAGSMALAVGSGGTSTFAGGDIINLSGNSKFISGNTITSGQAIDAGKTVALASLNFATLNTAQNLVALQNNTTTAFSTIDHLITGEVAGHQQAAADSVAAALQAAKDFGLAGASASALPASVVYQAPAAASDATPAAGPDLQNIYNAVWIVAGVATIYFLFKHKKTV